MISKIMISEKNHISCTRRLYNLFKFEDFSNNNLGKKQISCNRRLYNLFKLEDFSNNDLGKQKPISCNRRHYNLFKLEDFSNKDLGKNIIAVLDDTVICLNSRISQIMI